jgi:hypothetical protein
LSRLNDRSASTHVAGREQIENMLPTQHELRRYRDLAGKTLFFAVFLGTRSRGWRFFKPGEAPEFEGEAATFEVTVVKGRWVFGRQLR